MKGYKGFSPGMICRGKQYAENTVFEEDRAEICKNGMHFCENPMDVLDYYPIINDNGEINDFAEVESIEDPKTDDGKKFCTKKLKIGVKLSFSVFVNACVDFLFERSSVDVNAGHDAQLASSGDRAQLASSGDRAKLASSGDGAKLASSGDHCIISAIGKFGKAKAKAGSWITLAEFERDVPVCVKTEYVDGNRIKADTWYSLENGEFKEIE